MATPTHLQEAVGEAEFGRLLQDRAVIRALLEALAGALRRRHGTAWLGALYNPAPQDQAALGAALRECCQQLAQEGRMPDWPLVQRAAGTWLELYLRSTAERAAKLQDLVDRTAARLAGAGPEAPGGEILMSDQKRAAVAEALARELELYLGAEALVATEADLAALAQWLVREHLGAGALEAFLRDPGLTEILVGAGGRIWVERDGRLVDTGQSVPEVRALWFAQRLAAAVGSRVDQAQPAMDGFLPDGSRVHVVLPPIAMDGVSISIRRHTRRPTLDQLVATGALSAEAVAFLQDAVRGRANILVSGGTSSGKTTILGLLGSFIHPAERVLTMEDTPELRLPIPHVIRLRTRRANIEGQGEFTMRMLVRESLRMRPDRIVVGEVRGAEALDMVEAMNTGHDGCLATAHANGPLDLLKRLGQMMRRGDPQLTEMGAYELMASALHLIVHCERRIRDDGTVVRGVEEVVEVVDYRPDRAGTLGFTLRTLFRRVPAGGGRPLVQVAAPSAKLAGHLALAGVAPERWGMDHGGG